MILFVNAMETLALVGLGVVSGVFFAVAVSVIPGVTAMPPREYIIAHRLLGHGYHPIMPVLVNVTMLAVLVLAVLAESASRAFFIACAVLILGTQFVSHLCNVPINRQVHKVDVDNLPDDWQDPRSAWSSWHYVRTALAFAAFIALIFGIVVF